MLLLRVRVPSRRRPLVPSEPHRFASSPPEIGSESLGTRDRPRPSSLPLEGRGERNRGDPNRHVEGRGGGGEAEVPGGSSDGPTERTEKGETEGNGEVDGAEEERDTGSALRGSEEKYGAKDGWVVPPGHPILDEPCPRNFKRRRISRSGMDREPKHAKEKTADPSTTLAPNGGPSKDSVPQPTDPLTPKRGTRCA